MYLEIHTGIQQPILLDTHRGLHQRCGTMIGIGIDSGIYTICYLFDAHLSVWSSGMLANACEC